MSLKGFASKFLKPFSKERYVTVQPIGPDRAALDVAPKAIYPLTALNQVPTSLYSAGAGAGDSKADRKVLVLTAHGAREGDSIRWNLGSNVGIECAIDEIIDANTMKLGTILPNDILITDEFQVMRGITLTLNSAGSLVTTSGPIEYVLDGASQVVIEDTVTPANNKGLPSLNMYYKDGVLVPVNRDTGTPANNAPLPVEIIGVSGTTINITAGDIGVQLSHLGASADSTRIGDGTNLLGINASLEALVHDTDAIAELTAIGSQLPASLGQKASAASSPVVLSTEQEAMIDGIEALLTSIDGKDFATETTLAAATADLALIEAKDFSTETTLAAQSAKLPATIGQKASAASLAVVLSTEQEGMIDGIEALLTSIDGKDFATDTTLAVIAGDTTSMDAKMASLGQKISAGSMPVVISTEQEAMIDGIEALLTSIDGKDFATEATLASIDGKDFATETTLASLKSELTVVDQLDSGVIDATSINGSAGAFLEIVASSASLVKKVQIVEDIGHFMALYTGAASSEVFLCNLPLGGGDVEVNIPAATRIAIRSTITDAPTSGNMAVNLLG